MAKGIYHGQIKGNILIHVHVRKNMVLDPHSVCQNRYTGMGCLALLYTEPTHAIGRHRVLITSVVLHPGDWLVVYHAELMHVLGVCLLSEGKVAPYTGPQEGGWGGRYI